MSRPWRTVVSGLLLALGMGFCALALVANTLGLQAGTTSPVAFGVGLVIALLVLLSTSVLALGIWKHKGGLACLSLVALYGCLLVSGAVALVLALILRPPDVSNVVVPNCTLSLGLGILFVLVWRRKQRPENPILLEDADRPANTR